MHVALPPQGDVGERLFQAAKGVINPPKCQLCARDTL
jgi:hypothetical protein